VTRDSPEVERASEVDRAVGQVPGRVLGNASGSTEGTAEGTAEETVDGAAAGTAEPRFAVAARDPVTAGTIAPACGATGPAAATDGSTGAGTGRVSALADAEEINQAAAVPATAPPSTNRARESSRGMPRRTLLVSLMRNRTS
jgi:hypothetical protein